ncbi:TIGR00730 family Rossman fold protein [Actinomadura sp. NPDC049753]|uniref:LOG family protein n=1 Tax=Actinomadura sp. NPDC049753 TaxID=3154739 RepID=UPI003449829D
MTEPNCSSGSEGRGIDLPASVVAELALGGPVSPQSLQALVELALGEPVSPMALRTLIELSNGHRVLNGIDSGVWVCGSARTKPGTEEYELGVELGAALAAAGFAVYTGGGPGAMEAANKGAYENGGVSVGVGIVLPNEQQFNPYLTVKFLCEFFFTRKVLLTKKTKALVVAPGGNGSLDELYEVLTLVQTQTIDPQPIVLVGRKYWKDLDHFGRGTMLPSGKISPGDPDLIQVVDTVGEVMDLMPEHTVS